MSGLVSYLSGKAAEDRVLSAYTARGYRLDLSALARSGW